MYKLNLQHDQHAQHVKRLKTVNIDVFMALAHLKITNFLLPCLALKGKVNMYTNMYIQIHKTKTLIMENLL